MDVFSRGHEMKQIPLTKGYSAIVSDQDYPRLMRYAWHADVRKRTVYAVTSLTIDGRRREVRMHQMVLRASGREEVDHRDSNGLHNYRRNLRLATRHGQAWNSSPKEGSTIKGVTLQNRLTGRPWQARICVRGHQKHLGYFATKAEAAYAYNEAARTYYGRFAKLNPAKHIQIPTENYIRAVVSTKVVNDVKRGRWICYTLSCGHGGQRRYFQRHKIGKASHCKQCREAIK